MQRVIRCFPTFISVAIMVAVALLSSCTPTPAPLIEVQYRGKALGTIVEIELRHHDAQKSQAAITKLLELIEQYEKQLSAYDPNSEVSRINREAAHKPVLLSDNLFELLATSLQMSELTQGAFDISYASVGHLYHFKSGYRPDNEVIKSHLPAINFRLIELDPSNKTLFFQHPDIQINLGGIAKGYVVDRCIEWLVSEGFEHAVVNAGGDSRVIGNQNGTPWRVGVKHPRALEQTIYSLNFSQPAISTSGDYERFFDEDGVRYHHIIDPSTGMPSRKAQSVTITGPNATMTDALSTAVFVMGYAAGLELIKSLPNFDAVVVDSQGELHSTL